jgi:hypothetical protein
MAQATYRGVSYDTEKSHHQQSQHCDLTYRGVHYNTKVCNQKQQQPQQFDLNYRGVNYVKGVE